MKYIIIALSLIASTLISTQKAQAKSLECEQAIKDTNFIYALMEDHVYLDWAKRNNSAKAKAQVKIINNQARSLEKYCQLREPRPSQVQVRMNLINKAWDNIKKLSES